MKKKNDYKIIDKGFYNHPQAPDRVKLKQYIIVKKEGKKCLLLRFFNELQNTVTALEFVLTQLDANGEVIDNSVVNLDIKLRAGDMFTADCGIVINEKCVDFTVEIRSMVSGGYKYCDSNGRMLARYDRRLDQKKKPKKYGNMQIKRTKIATGALPAVVAVLIMVAFMLVFADAALRPFGKF